MKHIAITFAFILGLFSLGLLTGCSSSEEPAASKAAAQKTAPTVRFLNLKDGDTVKNPVNVKFGVSGMDIVPAGTEQKNSGHHHLLIDTELTREALTQPIPSDDHHKHFGKGQTEVTLTLKPGKHTLQLIVGDHNHIPHKPPVTSSIINIIVQ